MNNLNEILKLTDRREVIRELKHRGHRQVDNSMLSKFAHGWCNPTVESAEALCDILERDVYEIWPREALDYAPLHSAESPTIAERCTRPYSPKISIRVTPEIATRFAHMQEALRARGQKECFVRLMDIADRYFLRKRKNRPVKGGKEK